MIVLLALLPAAPSVGKLPFKVSLCVVSEPDALVPACAARAPGAVLVPTGRLDDAAVHALRRAMPGHALLVGVAASLAEATAASPELSRYDHVVTLAALEAEIRGFLPEYGR